MKLNPFLTWVDEKFDCVFRNPDTPAHGDFSFWGTITQLSLRLPLTPLILWWAFVEYEDWD